MKFTLDLRHPLVPLRWPLRVGLVAVLHPPDRLLVSTILLIVVSPARHDPLVGVAKVTAVVDLGEIHEGAVINPIPHLPQALLQMLSATVVDALIMGS